MQSDPEGKADQENSKPWIEGDEGGHTAAKKNVNLQLEKAPICGRKERRSAAKKNATLRLEGALICGQEKRQSVVGKSADLRPTPKCNRHIPGAPTFARNLKTNYLY